MADDDQATSEETNWVMSPTELDAYLAAHPAMAARIAARAQELYEQYFGSPGGLASTPEEERLSTPD